jgi:hypothetical protein
MKLSQGLIGFLPFFLFGDFRSLFLGISVGQFWGRFFEGFLLDVMYEDLVPLYLVILIQQTLRNGSVWVILVVSMGRCSLGLTSDSS